VAGRPATKPKSGDEGEQQESSAQLQGNSTSDNTRAQVFNLFDFFFSIFPTLTSYSMIVLLGSGNQ
jgi:hypothetical protein